MNWFIFFFLILNFSHAKKYGDEIDYELVERLLNETLNEKIDPCDNFFEFACGKWVEKQDLNLFESKHILYDSYNKFLHLFEDKYIPGKIIFKSNSLESVKYAHKKCITSLIKKDKFLSKDIKKVKKICNKKIFFVSQKLFAAIIFNEVIGLQKIKEIKKTAQEMFSNLKETLIKMIEKKRWLDEGTKQRIIYKINTKHFELKIPNELLDMENVERIYKYLYFDKKDSFVKIIEVMNDFRNLLNAHTKFEFQYPGDINPIKPNPYYAFIINHIGIMITVMVEPMFDIKFPTSMKYGSLGTILAHEIIHGYSGKGLDFLERDIVGELLSNYSRRGYEIRKQCIVDQYEGKGMSYSAFKAKGEQTHDENIPDNSGLKLAYKAYKNLVNKYGYEEEIKMNKYKKYTNDQLFWIAAGRVKCDKYIDERIKEMFEREKHLPGEYRVSIPFGNQKEFATDFNCKVGSKMNPKDKCDIWKYKKSLKT
uniref:Peptidase_M13 domain-containing protein n=1 Tax=Parastrongyloides trichosuri TaxID=131310 RepID=A0A0N4Z7I3_PARTI